MTKSNYTLCYWFYDFRNIRSYGSKIDLKRLIAYSAIGNAGYMLLGISAGNLEGLQGLLLFAVIYIVMSVNAFATILTLRSSNCLSTLTSQSTFH